MTQTTQQAPKSPLTPEGQKLAFAIANIVYDEQGVQMIQQALQNTKSEEAVIPQVALAATTILHKLQDKLDQMPEEEVWGKMGIVHLCLGSIFEVAKHLGYNVPASGLKQAYEMVEHMLEQQGNEQEGQQEDMQEPGEEQSGMQQAAMQQQGGMPPAQPQGAPMMQQAAMMGGPNG